MASPIRRNGLHAGSVVLLLVLSLLLTGGLAWQAQDAVRSHPAVAANVLRDYAMLAAGGSTVEHFGDVEVRPSHRAELRDGIPVELAPKEFDLLMTLLRHQGDVVPRDRLLQEVWGYASSVVTRTIDTQIAELQRKLEVDPSTPRHILTVRKSGYRLQR